MARLKYALPTIFLHEGRFSDDKDDTGGITAWGVSLQFLLSTGDIDHNGILDGDFNEDGKLTAEDIRVMTQEDAEHIYDMYFWARYRYSVIENQNVATKLLDLAVNMGSKQAHKVIQRAVRAVDPLNKISDDGILGVKSFTAINNVNPDELIVAMKSEAAGVYRMIVSKNPKTFKYLNGWMNRAYSDPMPVISTTFHVERQDGAKE